MKHCEWLSRGSERTAAEIFKGYVELMRRYADYFFRHPWPKQYDYEAATTFTEDDLHFLTAGPAEEGAERFDTMVLKKNINLEAGFMELLGPFWTWQAFHEAFIRPTYKPVQDLFDKLREGDHEPRSVLDQLKAQFDLQLIHDSLVDVAEHAYLEKTVGRLVAGLLELLHAEEGVPPCHEYQCRLQRKRLHKEGKSDNSV